MTPKKFLLEGSIDTDSVLHNVHIEAILNDEGEYNGRYLAITDQGLSAELINEKGVWFEKGVGQTEFASKVGELIGKHEE